MRSGFWILEGKKLKQVSGVLEWAKWFEDRDGRQIGRTELPSGVLISTVCLGIDHGWDLKKPPLVFETMIFRGPLSGYCERFATYGEAEKGHEVAVSAAKAAE